MALVTDSGDCLGDMEEGLDTGPISGLPEKVEEYWGNSHHKLQKSLPCTELQFSQAYLSVVRNDDDTWKGARVAC